MYNTVRIATWNANGLLQRLTELELFLNMEKIYICLISESHLTRNAIVSIRGYSCYHAAHPTDRATESSALLLKSSIKYYEGLKIEEDSFQVTTVKLQLLGK